MMRFNKPFLVTLILSMLFTCSTCMAQSFPDTVKLQQGKGTIDLKLTGTATRKKFLLKVYDIAHYMQDPPSASGSQAIRDILKSNKPKQFTMKWLRDGPYKKIKEVYNETFKDTLGSKEGSLKPQINKFIGFFKAGAKKGDKHIIRWTDGDVITVIINGKKAGEIKHPEFAQAVWNIWFGSKSVVDRNKLVSKL